VTACGLRATGHGLRVGADNSVWPLSRLVEYHVSILPPIPCRFRDVEN
jgi:hypothetical protein